METTYYHSDQPELHQQDGLNASARSMQSSHQQQRSLNDSHDGVKLNSSSNITGPLSPSSTSNSSHSSMSSHGAAISDDSERDLNAHRPISSSSPSSYNSSYGSNSGQKLINNSVNSITAEVPGGVVTTQNISTVIRPKGNNNSLQFVKINTPELSKKAVEQIKLAEETKISRDKIKEVEEEWQNNLLNWKSKRRQQFVHSIGTIEHDTLDRNNGSDGTNGQPRKVKTFAEMLEDRAKSGTRIGYNLQKYIGSIDDEEDTVYNVHSVNHDNGKCMDNYRNHSGKSSNDDHVDSHKMRFGNGREQLEDNENEEEKEFKTKNNHDHHQDPMKHCPDLLQNTENRTNMQIVDIGMDKSLNDDTSCDNFSNDIDKHRQHNSNRSLNTFRESSTPTKTNFSSNSYLTNLNNDSQRYTQYNHDKSSLIAKSTMETSHIQLLPQNEFTFPTSESSVLPEDDNDDDEEEEGEEEEGEEAEEQRQRQKIAFEAKLKAFENLAKVEDSSPSKTRSIRKKVTKTNNVITTTFSSDAKHKATERVMAKTNELYTSPGTKDTQGRVRSEHRESPQHNQKTRLNNFKLDDYKKMDDIRSSVNKSSDSCMQDATSFTNESIRIDCSGHLDSSLMTKQKHQFIDSQSSIIPQSVQMVPKQATSKGETVKINVNSPPISSRSMIRTINIAQPREMNQITEQMDANSERLAKMALKKPLISSQECHQEPHMNLKPPNCTTKIKNQGSLTGQMNLTAGRTTESNPDEPNNDRNTFTTNSGINKNDLTKANPRSSLTDKLASGHEKKGLLSVSGRKRCSSCGEELGRGAAAFVVESLSLYYHTSCFRCSVCHVQLSNGFRGVDVRVHANALHCQNCYSKDGLNYSRV